MLSPWPARAASPDDYDAYVRLFPQFEVPDPTPSRERWEREMMPHTALLDHEGHTFAYVLARPLGGTGHVFNVVVDTAFRGRGAGRALMEAAAARLREAGCSRWALNVKIDNTPAIRLYERCGLSLAHRSTAMTFAWDRVSHLPHEEGSVTARPVDPAEDPALEDAFGLPRGRLADLRGRRAPIILRLVDPSRPDDPKVGVASFDPTHPGAFPFAVARPALARSLLDAMRPHARPGDTFTRLVVEHDDALDRVMRDAGGEVLFELIHMEGDLPAAR